LVISDATLEQLREFRAEPKFYEDMSVFYPGAADEATRIRCESQLNGLIDRLLSNLPKHPTKQYVLTEFRATLTPIEMEDSEERDQFLGYLERIMDIVGIESSDGLLNEWRYGFDPAKAP
jgi:hypothetical protein